MSTQEFTLYTFSAVIIIIYEFILGVVRVQDYFKSFYERYDTRFTIIIHVYIVSNIYLDSSIYIQ